MKINPQNYLETHVANATALVLITARSFNIILLTHTSVLWLEQLILIISFVHSPICSHIITQCSHHAQSYTRNASSSVEVVQGEVSLCCLSLSLIVYKIYIIGGCVSLPVYESIIMCLIIVINSTGCQCHP